MNKKLMLTLLASGALSGMACPAIAHAFVALEELKIHEQPSEKSVERGEIDAGDEDVGIDLEKQKSAPPGWVAISGRDRLPVLPSGWVRKEGLAAPSDFKRVVGCWPIRESSPTSGEAPWAVSFKNNGAAVLSPLNVPGNSHVDYPAHVYMAGNLVFVKTDRRVKTALGFFGVGYLAYLFIYNPADRTLKSKAWDTETRHFPAKALEGCEGIRLAK